VSSGAESIRPDLGLMFSFRNPAQWRRPFSEVYADELRLIREAEELGYDTIWLTEHHFADDGYSPSVVTIAAAIAAMTERVRIGFNLLLLPLHNAIRVAEDIATLDVLADGRIDVGLGQGYATHEFAGYGIPRSERLGRFVEGLDVLQGLWADETFSYEGRHYRIDNARLVPKPVQAPMPLWIGATSEAGVRRAGRRGANLLGLASRHLQGIYEEARTGAGLSLDDAKVLQLHWAHVAPGNDEAWAEAAPHFHHLLEVYAQWANESGDADKGGPKTVVPPVAELRDPGRRLMFQPVFGDPDHVTRALSASMEKVRTTHLALGVLPGMDPARTRASMRLFASEVAPRL
jgi:alkanesulfonate monooxygenase SsuD/methylene tetrahydromethanopterin reductase-like flavin-dependent oxidoreductase (luciferase family)